jgi:glyoxylase-like metal-dependent hydrolase (beta-lactamase superfamily II)
MEVRVHTHGPGKLKTKTMIADELGFCVTSCLIMGEKDCVLIDTQWTRSNAYRVIAEIAETNLNLKAVFATHAHPDHYWGIATLKEAFPNCVAYAMPEDIETIYKQSIQKQSIGKQSSARLTSAA